MIPSSDAAALAALHATAFDRPWGEAEIAALLATPRVVALAEPGAGFVMVRAVADEAEILTLAVVPAARRRGLGRRLVEAAAAWAESAGAASLFLEVAEDNVAARALYAATGFAEAGRRPGYYARAGAAAVDALVLVRQIRPRLP